MDHIVASGFNTVLVHPMGTLVSERGWPKEMASWGQIQKDHNLHVIISWPYGSDSRYGNTQLAPTTLACQDAGPILHALNPGNIWETVIGDRAVIAAKGGLTGMVVDMEMYGADQTWYDGPCYCNSCWSRFCREHVEGSDALSIPAAERAAWMKSHGIASDYARWQEASIANILQDMRTGLAANPRLLGNLHAIEDLAGLARGFGTPEMPALIFGELGVQGGDDGYFNVSRLPKRVADLRKNGYPAIFVTGLWLLHVTPPDLPESYANSDCYAGYWVWSQRGICIQPTGLRSRQGVHPRRLLESISGDQRQAE